jgi:DNA-binding NarL/FixJ family response regulator
MLPPVILTRHATDLRHGLKEILEAVPNVRVIGTQAAAYELLALCRTASWVIAVLDFIGPAENTLEIFGRLRRERPDLRLIVMARSLDPNHIRHCLGLGVRGYLAAQDLPNELGSAVRAVLAGAVYLSKSAAHSLRDDSAFGRG